MIYLIVVFAVMLLIDLHKLLKSGQPRVYIVYGCVYAAALTLSVVLAMGIDVPSPLMMASDFFKKVLHINY